MSPGILYISVKSVVITLSELESGVFPDDLRNPEQIQELRIQKTQPEGEWITLPPLSWFESRELKPPYWEIPAGIAELNNLESLYLVHLDIRRLPDELMKLKNLKILDLSFNKLELSDEIPKLSRLEKLQTLKLLGNHFNVDAMERIKKDHPHIDMEYRREEE